MHIFQWLMQKWDTHFALYFLVFSSSSVPLLQSELTAIYSLKRALNLLAALPQQQQ